MQAGSDFPGAATRFSVSARHFLHIVDNADQVGPRALPEQLARELSDLYRAALQLPHQDTLSVTDTDLERWSDDTLWSRRYTLIGQQLGPLDTYWLIYNPQELNEPVAGSLADDLADIARDLEYGLRVLDRQVSPEMALWAWSESFRSHWGKHLVHALVAIHALIIK